MRSLVRDVRVRKFQFGCIFCRILGGVISNGCERAAAPTARFASSNPEASLEKRAGTSPGCGVFYGVTHVYLLRGGVISFRSLALQKSVHIPLHIHLHIHIHTHLRSCEVRSTCSWQLPIMRYTSTCCFKRKKLSAP